MAQLRDAQTSALIAEGTALELALVADELGIDAAVVGPGEALDENLDAIYDDVGAGFDPAAVLEAYAENLEGLGAAGKASGVDKATKDDIRKSLADYRATEENARAKLAPAAAKAQAKALAKVK